MKRLEQYIQKLIADPMFAISVDYRDKVFTEKWNRLVSNATNAKLTEQYGSAAAFMEWMNAQGMDQVRIWPRKQNGSKSGQPNYKPAPGMDMIELAFEGNAPQAAPIPAQPIAAQPEMPSAFPPGLNGMMAGMNMAEMAYRHYDHPKLVALVAKQETEIEKLKAIIDTQKETILENKYSVDKTNSQNDLIGKLAPLLAPIITKGIAGNTGAPVHGMAGPEVKLTATQQQLMSYAQQLDDDFAADVIMLINGMSAEEFDEDIQKLFVKHNLKKLENAV